MSKQNDKGHLIGEEQDLCYACGRSLKGLRMYGVGTADNQFQYVGSECYKKVKATGAKGFQPAQGGPRLFDWIKP